MEIEYVRTGKRGKLPDKLALILIGKGLVRAVLPEPGSAPKPKRQYRRRDMRPEE